MKEPSVTRSIRLEDEHAHSTGQYHPGLAPLLGADERTCFPASNGVFRAGIGDLEPHPTNSGVPAPFDQEIAPALREVGFDWLAVSIPHEQDCARIISAGDISSRGLNGRYRGVYEWYSDETGAWYGYAEKDGHRSTMIDLPGDALRARGWTGRALLGLIESMVYLDGHVRRLDLACDLAGELAPDLAVVRSGLERGEVASHCDRWYQYVQSTMKDGDLAGWTIYLGSPASDSRMRVYDKQAERLQAGCSDPGRWVRVEGQFRREPAHAAALQTLEGKPCGPILARICRWLEEPGGVHPERIPTAPWYRPVAEAAAPLGLHRCPVPATAERLGWIERSLSSPLGEAILAESPDWLLETAKRGAAKADPARTARLAAYRAEHAQYSKTVDNRPAGA